MNTGSEDPRARTSARKTEQRAKRATKITADRAGTARERRDARRTVRAVILATPSHDVQTRKALAELKTPAAKALARQARRAANATGKTPANTVRPSPPAAADASARPERRTQRRPRPPTTEADPRPGSAETKPAAKKAAPMAKKTAKTTKNAARKTVAKKASKPSDSNSRRTVAAARAAAGSPPRTPPPSPGSVRLRKAIQQIERDRARGAKTAPAPAVRLPGPGTRRAPLRPAPPKPVKRRAARTTVRKVSRSVRELRKHPLRGLGHGLLYLAIYSSRLVRACARGIRRRARLAAARRKAARHNVVQGRHAGCAYCHGTGTVARYDAELRFAGSMPCPHRR